MLPSALRSLLFLCVVALSRLFLARLREVRHTFHITDDTCEVVHILGMAARTLFERYGCAALVKGGHSINDANDVLFSSESEEAVWFKGKRINNPNTHGTGCTLSSAIASNLAKGYSLARSVENAKAYLSGALEAMLDLGKGSGPLAHNYALPEEFKREA